MTRLGQDPRWSRWFAPAPSVAGGGKLLLVIGVLGQAFALMLLLTSWSEYDDPGAALAVWAVLGVAIVGLALAGRLARPPLNGLVLLLVILTIAVADVVVPLSVRPGEDLLGGAGWNWGAAALVLLALGVYRPMVEVMLLGVAHASAAVAWAVFGDFPVDPVTAVMAVSGCLIPPLGAVQFLAFFQEVVAAREEALAVQQDLRAERAAAEAVQIDTERRLTGLRREALPMLQRIVDGAPLPLSLPEQDTARRVAEQLRHELVRGRDVDWLLQARLAPVPGVPAGRHGEVEVRVITGRGTAALLQDEDRAAIGALVELLRRHRGWREMTLTVAAGADERPAVALVARGGAALPAHADPGVRSAVLRLGGAASLEDDHTFVVQA